METIMCKELIVSTIKERGEGTMASPLRRITEVYEKDGTFIAEHDPAPGTFTLLDLVHFAIWIRESKVDAIDIKAATDWIEKTAYSTK